MPLYDYKCSKCGYVFEVQQRVTEEPLTHCPKCKGHIKRLIGPVGIIFKGSGFHVTDYGKKPKMEKKETKPAPAETSAGKPKETKSSKEAPSPPQSK